MPTELLHEVSASMSRNKLRVALTGFSIAFGIFMLIVLLAAGNGLLNGMKRMFGNNPNKMQVWGGWTSKEWQGRAGNRYIKLDATHFEAVLSEYGDVIEHYIPMINFSVTVSHGHNSRTTNLHGVTVNFGDLDEFHIVAGRWLNDLDQSERRKVAVLDLESAEVLFPKREPEACIGEWLKVNDVAFTVVGIYKSRSNFSRDQVTYCPFSTMVGIYAGSDRQLSTIHLTLRGLDTPQKNADFADALNRTMARIEGYDPSDHGVWIWNKAEDYLEHENMMSGIRLLIWAIGIASLFAGIVGISNIMLITVRERTREFGIRKAIGASPRSIVTLVLAESVAITVIFGYIGMFLGIALSQGVSTLLDMAPDGEGPQIFVHPTVDMGVVIGANVIMIIAGLIAGYVPAIRAAKIKPVVALAAV